MEVEKGKFCHLRHYMSELGIIVLRQVETLKAEKIRRGNNDIIYYVNLLNTYLYIMVYSDEKCKRQISCSMNRLLTCVLTSLLPAQI